MFEEILIKIFTGQELSSYPPEIHQQKIDEALDKFVDWLSADISSMDDPNAKVMAIRLKASRRYHDPNIFQKFPELQSYMIRAYNNFLNNLKVE